MIRVYFFFLVVAFFHGNSNAQKRNNIWAFGNNIGLNFNTDPVTPFISKSNGKTPPYYVSSICDKNGNLLFYTDGLTVWNGNNFALPKYKDWWPWFKNVIPLITPYVSNDSLYYLFGIDELGPEEGNSYKLQYLSIKMRNPGDMEEAVFPRPVSISSYYTTLLSNTSHVLAGTAHCNQKDTWITTHAPGALYSFLITDSGVNPVPVISPVPASILPQRKLITKYGNIKFSANGEKLIIPDSNKIVVFDFDNQTGKFSHPLVLSIPQDQTLEDLEISADGSKIYFGSFEMPDPDVPAEVHYLYQMDLDAGSAGQIENTLYKINSGDIAVCMRSCYVLQRTMQLGPDGKIYIIRRDGITGPAGTIAELGKTLDVINDPSKAGIDANYVESQVNLKRVPKVINYNYIRSASFTNGENSIQYQKNNCVDKPVQFSLIYTKLDSVKWEFGDPATGNENFSTLIKPQHLYSAPGSYTARAFIYNRCTIDTASVTVIIEKGNAVHLPTSIKDTVICLGGELAINTTTPFAKEYKWENGLTNPQRIIDKSGIYTISVFNDCSLDRKSFKVTFKVCPCNFFIPNAFSPNHDGLNDIFKPIFDCTPFPKDYQLKIYDRFGGVVFESNKANEGWDGKKRETALPIGIYVWVIKYRHPGEKEIIRKNGTVTLLR